MEKYCKKCGKIFIVANNQKRKKYCSFKCSHDYVSIGRNSWIGRDPSIDRKIIGGWKWKRKLTQNEICRLKDIGKVGGMNSAKNQKKRSSGEEFLNNLFVENKCKTIQNSWDIVKGYEIDIFLPEFNTAISYNGPVHRLPIYGEKRLKQIITRDAYRCRKLKELKVNHIIVDDEGHFNKLKVYKQFLWCIEQLQNIEENKKDGLS
jgi:hypothetical protein